MSDPNHAARVSEIESVMEDLIAKKEPEIHNMQIDGSTGFALKHALQQMQAAGVQPKLPSPQKMMEEILAARGFPAAIASYEGHKRAMEMMDAFVNPPMIFPEGMFKIDGT